MVTEVKLHYFRGRDSTTAVAVKNQVQLKNLRIAKFRGIGIGETGEAEAV